MSEQSSLTLEKARLIRNILLSFLFVIVMFTIYSRLTNTGSGMYWCIAPIIFVIIIPLIIIRFGIAYGWFDGDKEE